MENYAFLWISLPSLHTYDFNWLNFKFTSLRERQGDKFYHGRLGIIPKKFQMMRSLFYKDVFMDRIV